MKKLVIFDLDGTLLNTIEDLGAACNYALKEEGYPEHPMSSYQFMVGNGVRTLMQRALVDADEKTVDRLLENFKRYYDIHNCEHTVPYKGIPELLASLREQGVAVAVASNKYQSAVEKIIPHYFPGIEFAALEGQREGRQCKPDPSIVFSILNRVPTPKSEVLYVGDSGVDMETARRACVESVGVTWGYRPVSELRSSGANYIESKPLSILERLGDPF